MSGETTAERAKSAIIEGDGSAAAACAREWLAAHRAPVELVETALAPGLQSAGALWEEGEYFLPELVSSAEAMKAAMQVLEPAIAESGAGRTEGKSVVIGTVEGDIHDIGKSLVAVMLRAGGFRVVDLGVDVPARRFLEEAKASNANLVCMSALLTTTMTGIRDVIRLFETESMRSRVRLLAGGAPVTREWALEAGADGFASNAVDAVRVARQLTGQE